MKAFALLLILIYQNIFSIIAKNILGVSKFCRYSPTCSEYTKISVKKYGIIKGGYKSFKRILSCHPFYQVENYNPKITNPK